MSSELWQVIAVSLKVSGIATLVVMLFSIALAKIFVSSRSKIIRAFELLIYLPMAMPPVALGYGLLIALGPRSVIGTALADLFGIHIAFSFLGAVVAACAVSLGIGVRTMRSAFERIDQQQVMVAQLLGASRASAFFYVVLPQCRSAMIGGAILVFIRALGEFGATMVLAGNSLGGTRTLALAIWVGMETPQGEAECLMLVAIAAAISLFALILAEYFSPSYK